MNQQISVSNKSLSCDQHAGATDFLDLLLGRMREELGLDNARLLGKTAFAEHLVEALKDKKV